MNPTFTPKKLLNVRLPLLLCSLVLFFCVGLNQQVKAQTGCTINVTGCPPADLISPLCANKDSNGVLGAVVTWTPPSFALSCPGEGGSGYAFNMEFDLNESLSAAGCWAYNLVQRVGTDGGKLRLWQSTGTGNPWVRTPVFFMSGATNVQLVIHAVENFTVNVYAINSVTLAETLLTPSVNVVPGDSAYQFTITPPSAGSYNLRFEFIAADGSGSNQNYVDVLSVNAVVVAGCTGDVNFATVSNYNSPSFFPAGTTTVTYTATCNSCSNPGPLTATCSFNVTVNGIEADIVGTTSTSCGASNGTVTFDTTVSAVSANANALQYSVDGGTWITITSPLTITGLSGGAHTLNVRAYFNNTSGYCTILAPLNFNIGATVDALAPTITCPTPAASYNTNTGLCTASLSFTATATDLCDATPTISYLIGATPISFPYNFPKGTTTVTARATDDFGNSSQCTFNVVVVDNANPVITTCATAQSANTTAVNCTAAVPVFTAGLVVTDNCGNTSANITITQSPVAGTLLGVGVHTITITATDLAGHASNCTTTFTVTDHSNPVITTCATAQSANTTAVNCTAAVPTFTAGLVVTDNCGSTPANVTITQSPVAGTLLGVGVHTITITATDLAGNFSTCTTTFTVTDHSNPVITTCATAQSANTSAVNCTAAVPTFTAGLVVTDNCGSTPANVTITQSPVAGTLLGVGVHTITITATDLAGNFSTCTTTFTVTDHSNPVITTCPQPQSANAGANCTAIVPNFTVGVVASDNCSASVNLTITQSPAAGASVGLGVTTITITATDQAGNVSTCTTTFTVTGSTAPTITCPANITMADDGCGTAIVAITPPTASNCFGAVTPVGVRSDGLPLTAPYPIGVTTITWTATAANQTTSCTQTITVTKSEGTIIANYTFLGFTAYPFNANETAPGISSNVNSTQPFAYTGSGTPTGPLAFKTNAGTNEALVLQPSSGNNTRYIQFVVSGATLKYYSEFKVYLQAERQPQGATMITLAYSKDNVTYTNVGTLAIPDHGTWYEKVFDLSTIAALNGFDLTTLYFRVYASGSNANGSSDATRLEIDNFQVFAEGVGPTITCPADITVTGNPATCTAIVTPGTATGLGRCGTPNISSVRSDGKPLTDPFPIGVTTITWKATDENGAFATCVQTITVNPTPECIVPATGLQLKGNRNGPDVHLNWFTLTEQNTSHFIMERSFDGVRFEPLPTRVPAAGNSNAHRNYNLLDKNVLGAVVYYRVKMYDNNGQMKMSNLVAITLGVSKQLRVYPNPVRNFVTIEFAELGNYQVDLISANGQLVLVQKDIQVTNSFRTLTMQRNNLVSGQYQMRIWNKTTGKVDIIKLVYLPKE